MLMSEIHLDVVTPTASRCGSVVLAAAGGNVSVSVGAVLAVGLPAHTEAGVEFGGKGPESHDRGSREGIGELDLAPDQGSSGG